MKKKTLIFLILSILIAGCNLGSNITNMDIDEPSILTQNTNTLKSNEIIAKDEIPEQNDGKYTSIDCFDFDDGTITKYTCSDNVVNIPSDINGVAVTHIGESAFYDTKLKYISIPDSVVYIGKNAFTKNQLEQVIIGNGVSEIGEWAFSSNNLKELLIPDSLTNIGQRAFNDNELKELFIPNTVSHIGDKAFINNELNKIEITNPMIDIGEDAFAFNQLTQVINYDGTISDKYIYLPKGNKRIILKN